MVLRQVSVSGLDFLTSVYARSWTASLIFLDRTALYESLRLVDQIDRQDLSELLRAAGGLQGVDASKLKYVAEVVLTRQVPANAPSAFLGNSEAASFIAQATPLQLTQDPTWTLPLAAATQRTLSPTDYAAAAASLGVDEATVRTVATVESGGRTGFGEDGRCKIRYELHTFKKLTRGAYTRTHPHLSNTYDVGKVKEFHRGNTDEWSHLYGAALIRRTDEGISATSWGMFQIMGSNYAASGFNTPAAFASAMCVSAGAQLTAFVNFCKHNQLTKFLVKRDWAGFASRYNGPSYADNKYDEKLAAGYKRYAASNAHP